MCAPNDWWKFFVVHQTDKHLVVFVHRFVFVSVSVCVCLCICVCLRVSFWVLVSVCVCVGARENIEQVITLPVLQLMFCPVLVLMRMVMMMVCPALLVMLMKNDDTLLCAVAALLCVVAHAPHEYEEAQPCAVAHAHDDDGALIFFQENDLALPCAVALAHEDDALPLLLLMMMICLLLFLMSLCHTHPDFFKHHRKRVQIYERRHVDKHRMIHLFT